MKKFICCLISLIVCLSTFSYMNFSGKKSFAANFYFGDEEEITSNGPVKTIVSTERSEMTLSENDVTFDNISPFNTRTETLMGGYCFTPKTNEHNEIEGKYFHINSFTLDEDDSIYMWIYMPDSPIKNFYSLTISFYDDNNNSFSWFFSFVKLYEMAMQVDQCGWKLFELRQSDATKNGSINGINFTRLYINYSVDIETYREKYAGTIDEIEGIGLSDEFYNLLVKTSGKMSFYHVFATEKQQYKSSSNILINRQYYNYKVKDSIKTELSKICLGDEYKIKKINQIFDYLYVGKYNLLTTGGQNYIFSIIFNIVNENYDEDVREGETYKFRVEGQNYFNIKVIESKYGENTTVFTDETPLNISSYKFGKFFNSYYEIDGEIEMYLTFTIYGDFTPSDEIEFTSGNEKIIIVEDIKYSTDGKVCSVKVKTLKNGYTNITASVKGSRENMSESKYNVTVSVHVSGINTNFFQGRFFWIMFGITMVFVLAFVVITLINWKRAKNIVY